MNVFVITVSHHSSKKLFFLAEGSWEYNSMYEEYQRLEDNNSSIFMGRRVSTTWENMSCFNEEDTELFAEGDAIEILWFKVWIWLIICSYNLSVYY
jgi:hypothetical protein